ncbi:helix-turn-helix domain-containing protein [Enteractinococcus coprophilus]|uniref:DNA-binding Xre family transcriptional regulator n=1 Tax=Enteractinococcus coprophilus TaxID=1027633 RepID=A0A543ANV9_9MICC|nr:helix-turn-helix transcriptional regulator [Enteractinococcus coprophilus]TQL74236.1 DNA-binding Xre family transcriptional regulator [Enteractinococcus coprophilus]
MNITFKPLRQLLIEPDMTKEYQRFATELSTATIAKVGKEGNVTTEVLARICEALDCRLEQIALALATVSNNDGDRNERQS